MPHWGRPPGGSSGVGRYYEGAGDDVYRFQELGSEDEKDGVILDQAFQPALNGRNINPDELYFNDMDIRAWEKRASALGEPMHGPGYRGYHEEYFGGADEPTDSAESEEILFQRVLDKIRLARAAGNTDVSLSTEELDAYQSRLYGARASAVRPEPQSRPTNASLPHDAASIMSYEAPGKHGSSSRSRKSQQRSSLFGSKPKKEKQHSSHKRTSTQSTAESHTSPPGFVVPGPGGQSVYAPINAYEGPLARKQESLRPASHSASDTSHHMGSFSQYASPRNMLGSFPESVVDYRPSTPPRQGREMSSRQAAYEAELPPGSRTRSSSIQSRLVPFPVEPYQYHNFSASSSSSPTSPQPQYSRRVSSGPSEASYASVPRRVPAPTPAPAPIPLQRVSNAGVGQGAHSDAVLATLATSSATPAQSQETTKSSGGGHGGERRRKSGKSRKKG